LVKKILKEMERIFRRTFECSRKRKAQAGSIKNTPTHRNRIRGRETYITRSKGSDPKVEK
jgi:hypothetical protein